MEELFAAGITTIDIVVVFAFLQIRKRKFTLVLWTAFLNMVLPFLGFLMGEFSLSIFTGWSTLLSSVLLVLIGLHMLLQDDGEKAPSRQLHPALIALAVSLDNFSVSVSFGMLSMDKVLFITASGLSAFVCSYIALHYKEKLGIRDGKFLRLFAGVVLVIIGVMSWI